MIRCLILGLVLGLWVFPVRADFELTVTQSSFTLNASDTGGSHIFADGPSSMLSGNTTLVNQTGNVNSVYSAITTFNPLECTNDISTMVSGLSGSSSISTATTLHLTAPALVTVSADGQISGDINQIVRVILLINGNQVFEVGSFAETQSDSFSQTILYSGSSENLHLQLIASTSGGTASAVGHLSATISAVPEPSAAGLLVIASMFAVCLRIRNEPVQRIA